jgi:hypothetical protein
MRHLNSLTRQTPKRADAIEDTFCAVTSVLAALIRAIGGNAPGATYLETKCNFGIPVE